MSDEEDDFRDEHFGPQHPANGPVTFATLIHVLKLIASNANGSARNAIKVSDIEHAIRELEK